MKNFKILMLVIILLFSGLLIGCISLTTPKINSGGEIGEKFSNGVMTKKIIFFSNQDGNYEIYMMDPDGSNQDRLITNSSKDFSVDLSPKSTKILFETDRNGSDEINIMDIDGEN